MITLHLHGKLAELYGSSVTLDAATPREAVTALAFQDPEYKEYLRVNDWHIFVGEANDITESELDMKLGNITDVYLVPRIEGSSGAVNFIIGAVLVVVGIIVPGAQPLIYAGVGMMVGGIIQMTTKVPGVDSTSRDSNDDKASFLFNGPTNTASQGVAIPRGYGRMLTGSIVVSASLYSENVGSYSTPPPEFDFKVSQWKRIFI